MELKKVFALITSLIYMIFGVVILLVITITMFYLNPSLFKPEKMADIQWRPNTVENGLPEGKTGKQVKFGYLLTSESSRWMGPMVKNPDMRFAGNNLACKNCHLDVGARPGSASWIGVTDRFPQFRGRENKIGTIEERINGCMERSMNGKKLPNDSKQMEAIVAYMKWLSEDVPEERVKEFKGFPNLNLPQIAANPVLGKAIYIKECQVCHGANGEGVWLADSTKGYQYPPLWGNDSYNDGAGMNRVITAAQFIKGNMPWGQATWDNPKLTDEEAYHVAAYIDSFDRPIKSDKAADFPDRKLKPVSTPYGPWADDFSPNQHKYGPYQPIITIYKEQYGITKTK